MAILKGFASVPSLSDNNALAISPIGELSNKVLTYSKDRKIYSGIDTNTDTMIFSTKDNAGLPVTITDTLGNSVASVSEFIINYSLDNPGNYVKNTLTGIISDNFAADFDNFILGDFINKGTVYTPRWVSFTSIGNGNEIKIWFSGADFASQYDEYEIIVIPRIANVAAMASVTTVADLTALIAAGDDNYIIDAISVATSQHTPTAIERHTFQWVSPVNPANTKGISFAYVIYGNGFDLSKIKLATINLLISTTGGVDTAWRVVFPSLFGDNNYVVVPHWDKFSIPNASPNSAFYSPVTKEGDNVEYGSLAYGVLNSSYLVSYARTTNSTYRGLVFTIYPEEDNVAGPVPFEVSYTDYFSVSSQSPDFSRLQGRTQDLIRVLDKLIMSAEILTNSSLLEIGVSRETIGGKLFAVANTSDGNSFKMISKNDVVNR